MFVSRPCATARPFATGLLTAAAIALTAGTALASLPQGVAAGDTTATSSVLWAATDTIGNVQFEYSTDPAFGVIEGSATVSVTDILQPAKAAITTLNPGTQYFYRATDSTGATTGGRFRTSAAAGVQSGFRFGVSGDWRGELAPYPAVRNAVGRDLDLWVALGDTIYADYPSPGLPQPQAVTLEDYRRKHAEVYSTRLGLNTLGDLRASTSTLANIDDHEVINDFAGGAPVASDPRFTGQSGNLINETPQYNNGIQAFNEYNPVNVERYSNTGADPRMDDKVKIYRERSFGSDAAVFSLDARSFRDTELPAANLLDPASIGQFLVNSFDPSRTMLGQRQLADVKAGLLDAQNDGQTWKFVMVPEPIQNLGVLGASDRFEGYAAERSDLLRFIDQNNIENVVFVAADIHGTLVNNLTYQDFPGGAQRPTGAFEITTGSVAFDAPFGPTVAQIAFGLGIPGALNPAIYNSLSLPLREVYIEGLVNAQLDLLDYDRLGLQGSDINATLLQGGYVATNTFGWTEFNIDPLTQLLLVTTYGILPYTEAELLADPDSILARQPFVVSQFEVVPIPSPAVLSVFVGTLAFAGRRRRA